MLTLLAMIAFASNSLLCRAALKESSIDAATFTFLRIFSGAVALWLIMSVRTGMIVERTTSPLVETGSSSSLVVRHVLFRYGNWISAAALFVYAAGFSFAYVSLSAGTGALLLFGAVQATMILWGLHKGERLSMIQIVGFILAVIGFVVLVFPGLSAPPLAGSILMLGAGVAWGVYSLRGKGDCGNCLRHNIGRGYIRSRLCRLVQGTVRAESCERRDCSTQRSSAGCHRWDPVTRRTNHAALSARLCRCVRWNRARRSNSAFAAKLAQRITHDGSSRDIAMKKRAGSASPAINRIRRRNHNGQSR